MLDEVKKESRINPKFLYATVDSESKFSTLFNELRKNQTTFSLIITNFGVVYPNEEKAKIGDFIEKYLTNQIVPTDPDRWVASSDSTIREDILKGIKQLEEVSEFFCQSCVQDVNTYLLLYSSEIGSPEFLRSKFEAKLISSLQKQINAHNLSSYLQVVAFDVYTHGHFSEVLDVKIPQIIFKPGQSMDSSSSPPDLVYHDFPYMSTLQLFKWGEESSIYKEYLPEKPHLAPKKTE